MMYYSDEARMSAIENIRDCIEKIGQIKGSELSGHIHILTIAVGFYINQTLRYHDRYVIYKVGQAVY